ncbi:MAG: UDP-N-acetylglucosamine 1-carboxyvinyltransferase [Clostridiales bacterium]|jgi:UDP-N-acetylglucosamine 1-carboxyvinyltransferase|nr:UDP-N-acetylglucosamine 1-carboxyvinyltransferase [Clostridiales bacterium]
MGEYHVRGGNALSGEIRVSGSKNAILPILAATILTSGTSVIRNCPKISDTYVSIEILEALGCKVKMEDDTITVDSSTANDRCVPEKLVREMRSSIIFLGGVLGRFNRVKISYPGGCELGVRPIDLHLKAIREMNVTLNEDHGFIIGETTGIKGASVNLDFPSVGATENIMLTAVLADGVTKISNAAKEPEIIDLQDFLNKMGANISGAGTDIIIIEGVKKLGNAEHSVMFDRIVAGTYLVAAAITKGGVTLTDVNTRHLTSITSKLTEAGCEFEMREDTIRLSPPKKIRAISRLITLPHPGFPTDAQAQFAALLSIANGASVIEETLFESRNKHIGELSRMGANIRLAADGRTSVIRGVPALTGAVVNARDLRGGAALILAGLAASGETTVKNSHFIERGYENIDAALSSLGADIKYIA